MAVTTVGRGILSRIFNRDDSEKWVQHFEKEEATVLARMENRSLASEWIVRNIVFYLVLFEVIALNFAVKTAGSIGVLRVLPMFLLPAVSSILYSALMSFTMMRHRRDQGTLQRLRDERQAKINGLNELTNYYNTQQLIQEIVHDGGWFARVAAFLVGEDPTRSYTLICGNCHMYNGLARTYIAYYCPYCHALNRQKNSKEHSPVSVENANKRG